MKLRWSVGAAAAALVLCACTDHDPGESSAPHLVASVPQANGNLVELYEVSPGNLIVSEAGTAPNPPTLTFDDVDAMSTRELYLRVSGDAPIPSTLEAALARQQQLHDTGVASAWTDDGLPTTQYEPARIASATASGSATCSATWFVSSFCNTGSSYYSCKTYQTSSQAITKYDVIDHSSVVCSYSGTPILAVGWRPWFDWYYASWNVPAGTYRWWRRSDSTTDFDVKSSVYFGSATIGYHYHYEGAY